MTDALLAEQAALWIDDMHTRLARYEPLPGKLSPSSMEAAYAIQDALVRRMQLRGLRPLGRKIALTARTMQEMAGIDHPVGGTIVGTELVRSPARLRAADFGRIGLECEVAVRLGTELKAGSGPFTDADIVKTVDVCAAAFEIVDDRNADYHELDALNLVADNTWNAGMVIGEPQRLEDWSTLADASATLVADGETVGEGRGADAMGHPFNAVRFLADELTALGRTLRAGEWILSGTVIRTHFPAVGSSLSYRHSLLGEITAEIV